MAEKDLRSHPEQDMEHEVNPFPSLQPHRVLSIHPLPYIPCTKLTRTKGASPGELLIEAARRNNTDLLKEVIDGCESAEKAAILLNETKTVLGNYLYHEAALRGNCLSPFPFPFPSSPSTKSC